MRSYGAERAVDPSSFHGSVYVCLRLHDREDMINVTIRLVRMACHNAAIAIMMKL